MKELTCRDAGFDCDAVVEADSEAELMGRAAQHVQTVHGMDVTPTMVSHISSKVRTV